MRRSGFTSSTVRITSSNRVTSPRTTGAPMGTSPKAAAPGFRSMPTTVSPRATSRRMSRGPMNPVAPITSTGIRISYRALSRRATAEHGRAVPTGAWGPSGPPWQSIGLGGISGPPCSIRHSRRLPGDHAPVVAGLRVDREIADREALLLAIPLDVHLRDAADDANAPVNAHLALARRDAPIVRLARAQVRHVLGLRL